MSAQKIVIKPEKYRKKLYEEYLRVKKKVHKDIANVPEGGYILNGVLVDAPYILGVNELNSMDIINEPNAEIRTALIRWVGLIDFIKGGGGKLVEGIPNKQNRPDISVWEIQLPLEEGKPNHKMWFALLINHTPEPGSEKLTEEEREKSGLTKEGFKKYVVQIPVKKYGDILDVVGHLAGFKEGVYGQQFEIRGES